MPGLDALAERFPRLYHMAEPGSWDSVRARGLLSTSALLDLFEVRGPARAAIESARRPQGVPIEHPVHGRAVVRDQIPLREAALARCLDGMTPRQWYELLNRKVFFWPTEEGLLRLLGARAYRDREHTVIEVDTRELLKRHGPAVTLSPINSGSTLFDPARRGPGTFCSPEAYPDDWWRRRRVAELAVEYAVPDIADLALSVGEWRGPNRLRPIWSRRR